ncbi:MAG: hypothetical protein DRQ51_05040 [Gammaproteobacteria bacterium]|nr:MAG: hypothetical protein DRQ51_05040 [Gammaproteobacteria bacterium]
MKNIFIAIIFYGLLSSIALSDNTDHTFGAEQQQYPNVIEYNNSDDSNEHKRRHTFGSTNPQDNLQDYPPIPGLDYQVEQNAPKLPNNDEYNYQQQNSRQTYNPRGGFVYPPFNYNSPSNIWQYAPQPNNFDDFDLNPANPWQDPKRKRY